MKRRNFLRDIALGIAATLLPKILQPMTAEIMEEEIVKIPIRLKWSVYGGGKVSACITENKDSTYILELPKSSADFFIEECKKRNINN